MQPYVFLELAERLIAQIEMPDILKVLSPIWLAKPGTAKRVRRWIGTVLDWATAAGYREGEDPVRGVIKGLPNQAPKAQHDGALPHAAVSGFIQQLRDMNAAPSAKLAFDFLILTTARTGEVIGATWAEIDLRQRLWIIPRERMKAGRPHRGPLSD